MGLHIVDLAITEQGEIRGELRDLPAAAVPPAGRSARRPRAARNDPAASATAPEAAPRAELPSLALMLDGQFHGLLDLTPMPDGGYQFHRQLPPHAVFGACELRDAASGRNLLVAPLDLTPHYDVRLARPEISSYRLTGSFTTALPLGPYLQVAFSDAIGPIAEGLARSVGPDTVGRAVYRFALPLLALLGPGQRRAAAVQIGGWRLPGDPVVVDFAELRLVGLLDSVSNEEVRGWAVDLDDPGRPVALELRIDGVPAGQFSADGARPDLLAVGFGNGGGGIVASLPPADPAVEDREIAVLLAGTETHLANSPVRVRTRPKLLGFFDTFHGMSVHGWAHDPANPDQPVTVEVVAADGRVLGRAEANKFRGDLLDAGIARGLCAFQIDVGAHFAGLIGQEIFVRAWPDGDLLPGSPKRVTPNPNLVRLLRRRERVSPRLLPRLKRRLNHRAGTAAVSIIMPVHNTPQEWLVQALESVRTQWCDHWELICVDDASTAPHVRPILQAYARHDPRIRVLVSPENVGIARATNFGLRAARHHYVSFMDHDDLLEPDAVWHLIRGIRATAADLLYSDEVLTDQNIDGITEIRGRPSFSYDYYLSHPYFVHMICVRTALAREVGGWDESMAISADVDFVLRVLERAHAVAHIPNILYRWRTHGGSAGHAKQQGVMAATKGALQRHLDRCGTGAKVADGPWFNQFRINWPDSGGKILIVIPTKDKVELLRTCIESIERTAGDTDYRLVVIDHESREPATKRYLKQIARRHVVMPYHGEFNFSRMNNCAVQRHGADAGFVLFLNNDVEATQPGWLPRMRSLANRADVGAVGALLLYADQRVQHAGVIIGFNESADHALKFQPAYLDENGRRNLGYNCSLTSVRDFSAVTAACLMMRREVFETLGGFDESFGVGFNDTDLCLRVREHGLKVLYDGYTILFHYESATRAETKQVLHPEDTNRLLQRWERILREGDPFYNPNLSLRTQDHVAREDSGCRGDAPPRVTAIDLAPPPRSAQASAAGPSEGGRSAKPQPVA